MESTYRNPISQVKKFFETRHNGHYRIYNLCSERSYNPDEFNCEVTEFPFDDHNVPELGLIKALCDDINTYLQADEKNVAAIHCKAGKGRTGMIIACYLVYIGLSAESALNMFGRMRTANSKGVTIPSQIRYVNYFASLVTMKSTLELVAWDGSVLSEDMSLAKITLSSLPMAIPKGWEDVICFKIYNSDGDKVAESKGSNTSVIKEDGTVELTCRRIMLRDDLKFVLTCEKSAARTMKLFQFWIHTAMIDDPIVVLTKKELDGAVKDKHHKLYPADFKVLP